MDQERPYHAKQLPEGAFGQGILVGSVGHSRGLECTLVPDGGGVVLAAKLTPVVGMEMLDGHPTMVSHVSTILLMDNDVLVLSAQAVCSQVKGIGINKDRTIAKAMRVGGWQWSTEVHMHTVTKSRDELWFRVVS